jgi:chaperonin GroEL
LRKESYPLAFLRAIDAVDRAVGGAQGDERTALEILKHALKAPTPPIAENSGADGGVVVARMREERQPNME